MNLFHHLSIKRNPSNERFLISQIKDFSFIFNQVSEVILQSIGFPLVSSMIGPKSSCLCLNQSDANVKTITTGSLPFSRAFATWLIFTTGFHRCKSPHISITYQFLSDHMIQLKLMIMPGFVGSRPKKKKSVFPETLTYYSRINGLRAPFQNLLWTDNITSSTDKCRGMNRKNISR